MGQTPPGSRALTLPIGAGQGVMNIRVATLNVWGLPPLSPRVPERMAAIGDRLASLNLDVVAFQEVWTAEARRVLRAAGQRAGLVHAWHKSASLGGSGLVVLSRLPIDSIRFEGFELDGVPERLDHGDFYAGKGFVSIRVNTQAGPVTVIATHLHAPYSGPIARQYRAHRIGQIIQIAMAARETDDPILALGDFNFREDEPEYAIFTGLTGARDTAAELDRRQPTVRGENAYRRNGSRPRRVDYVFARDGVERGITPLSIERSFDKALSFHGQRASYSNHAGLVATFAISEGATPLTRPSPGIVARAREFLSEGRANAERRQRGRRTWAGLGFGCAAVASVGLRSPNLTRRRLLRGSLQCVAVTALAPGVGLTLLSEVFVPSEIRAFDTLANRLRHTWPDDGELIA
jgi:endonuclease/exonuclease/phosphatase family metal-dependent hydrolase